MRYATSRYQAHVRDLAYRIYVSDALQAISTNTAALIGEHGRHMTKRWYDVINATKTDSQKSGEEIVENVLSRICKNGGE